MDVFLIQSKSVKYFSGVARILVTGGHSDVGFGGIPPGKVLKFGSLKRHFLQFEGTVYLVITVYLVKECFLTIPRGWGRGLGRMLNTLLNI